ncbi:unnamed protein product [Rodentolepis nana]|uniref:Mitochondrial import inner membrane translocase subunit n=1 Tax=Rodentolepis nana TaxID=102285 RepID=A0A0R3TUV1_RODNA|nr:unnamed protein product [Rodentolepis nana]
MTDQAVEQQMRVLEIEMMQSMFAHMTDSCLVKCIPPRYTDGDLSKGEAVCIDRCAAKFMEAYSHTVKTLGSMNNPGINPQ